MDHRQGSRVQGDMVIQFGDGNTGIVKNSNSAGAAGSDILELRRAVGELANHIVVARNENAAAALSTLMSELRQEVPQKHRLRDLWAGLVRILPEVATVTDAGTKIANILSS
jgi:hypothetical protein